MVIETVEGIKRTYSKREFEGAEKAQRFYMVMGLPTTKTVKSMIEKGLLLNNPMTVTDY
jgi:hypothetical protein